MRYLNGRPAVLEEVHLDRDVCPTLNLDDLSEALYVMYRRKLNLWITTAEDRVTQRPVPDWVPDEFGLKAGANTICVLRTSFDQNNRAVEYSFSWIDTNIAQYVARIK